MIVQPTLPTFTRENPATHEKGVIGKLGQAQLRSPMRSVGARVVAQRVARIDDLNQRDHARRVFGVLAIHRFVQRDGIFILRQIKGRVRATKMRLAQHVA